jgi:hypothetical protein
MRRMIVTLLVVLAGTTTAEANVGPPTGGGQITGEPLGIRNVRIDRETLIIDLRPIVNGEQAQIEATYYLNNTGPEQTLELLFASGSSQIEGFEVRFNGQTVPVALAGPMELPASWKPPKQTPSIDDRKLDYDPAVRSHQPIKPIQFTLTIPPGQQVLQVRYQAEMGTNYYGHPTVYRQFAYILAPARSWDGFGKLDITVHVPPQWEVATNLELTRDGETLRGTFEGVPADHLAITLQAQPGADYYQLVTISKVVFWVTAGGGLVLAWVIGRWAGRRVAADRYSSKIWPIALTFGVIWGIAFAVAGWFKVYGPEIVLPANQVSHYGYDQLFEAIAYGLLAPYIMLGSFLITYITGVLVARWNSRH